jgi:tyrosyl-tRNA synthetase
MVHSEEDYNAAVEASQILFGNATADALAKLDEETFLSVFEGVPQFEVEKSLLDAGVNVVELVATSTNIFPSKGEARKMVQGGGVSINKNKVESVEHTVSSSVLLNGKFLLIQKGKKNYFIIRAI